MVQIGWNGSEYGLIPIGRTTSSWSRCRPRRSRTSSTSEAPGPSSRSSATRTTTTRSCRRGEPRDGCLSTCNTRFFRLSHDGVEVVVRVPSGDSGGVAAHPGGSGGAHEGQRRQVLQPRRIVYGTAHVWDDAADNQGDGYRGIVTLPGDPAAGHPAATCTGGCCRRGRGTDVSSRTDSGGSIAVLFQNELHDWRTSNQANPFFARLGVLFGKTRIAFVLEPLGARSRRTSRARTCWSAGRRSSRATPGSCGPSSSARRCPRHQADDGRGAGAAAGRGSRSRAPYPRPAQGRHAAAPAAAFPPCAAGTRPAAGPAVDAGGGTRQGGELIEFPTGTKPRSPVGRARAASVPCCADLDGAERRRPANEVFSILSLEPKWVTEEEAEDFDDRQRQRQRPARPGGGARGRGRPHGQHPAAEPRVPRLPGDPRGGQRVGEPRGRRRQGREDRDDRRRSGSSRR